MGNTCLASENKTQLFKELNNCVLFSVAKVQMGDWVSRCIKILAMQILFLSKKPSSGAKHLYFCHQWMYQYPLSCSLWPHTSLCAVSRLFFSTSAAANLWNIALGKVISFSLPNCYWHMPMNQWVKYFYTLLAEFRFSTSHQADRLGD